MAYRGAARAGMLSCGPSDERCTSTTDRILAGTRPRTRAAKRHDARRPNEIVERLDLHRPLPTDSDSGQFRPTNGPATLTSMRVNRSYPTQGGRGRSFVIRRDRPA